MVRKRLHWLLVWLQAVALFLALSTEGGKPFCHPGQTLGICDCEHQDSTCWRDQGAYRVEFAALLTYMILAVLAAIGLESFSLGLRPVVAAVHVLAVTLVIPIFCSLFFPLPNQLFTAYSYFIVLGAAISRLLQVVLWIDFSYDLNDKLFGHARDVHRRTISGALHKVRLPLLFIFASDVPGSPG